jgi:hypothetical protein
MKTPNLAAPLLALAWFSSAALAAAVPAQVHDDQDAAPRFVPDCADVVFQPEDPPASKPVPLTSQEWYQDCVPAGTRGQDCWERAGQADSLTVRLSIVNRKPLLPWESDVFRACLTGPALRVDVVSAAYDYALVRDGAVDGDVIFTPGAKRLLPPDPRGVQAVLTPNLTLTLRDQWASYYPGESILLKIAVKKAIRFWPDETVAVRELRLRVADNYVVELGAEAVLPGELYYVRYSVARLGGAVSTEAETPALETQTVSFEPDRAVSGL